MSILPYNKRKHFHFIFPYFALLGTTIIWALAGPIVKLALRDISPLTFLLFRFSVVCTLLLPYLFFELRRHPIDKRDLKNIVLLGFFGQTSIAFIFLGLNLTTAIDAAIISTLTPIFVILAGYYFYKEELTQLEKLGIFIATAGALLVVVEPALSSGNGTVLKRLFGNLLVLIYQITWPLYIILGKRMMGQKSRAVNKAFHYFHLEKLHDKYNPTILTTLTFYVGLLSIVPLALAETYLNPNPVGVTFNFPVVFGIYYMAIFSSIVAYFLFQWGIKRMEATESALFTYISPLFTIPAAKLILGEIPSKAAIYGIIVIAVGVIIAERYKS